MAELGEPSVPLTLTIAGSDSIGGAGIEMDLKVFQALGVYGAAAITALTAQNSEGVRSAWGAPAEFVGAQIDTVCDDVRPAAVKSGMLYSADIVAAVAERLRHFGIENYVLDPVVTAKDGSHLLSDEGLEAVKQELMPLARVVTPNLPEASALLGMSVTTLEEARWAAAKLGKLGGEWVLLKGGHLEGDPVDLLWHQGELEELPATRIPGGPFHGTGCALSAAIAAGLAKGQEPRQAILNARTFLRVLLPKALALGKGSRLLNPNLWSKSHD